jgi:spore coat protein U-like protein
VKRLVLLSLLLAAAPASAAVTCTLSTITAVAFGAYDVNAVLPRNSQGTISFTCSGGSALDTISIEIGPGSNSTSIAARKLNNGAFLLNYNLYRDVTRLLVWGNTLTTRYSATPPNGSRTLQVFGSIPALQAAASGSYGDTLTVTLQY